jgi:hypothetical protein
MVIDLILNELFLMLLYLILGFLEPSIELSAFLGKFGVFFALCVELPRKLHDTLLLKGLLFHSNYINQLGK